MYILCWKFHMQAVQVYLQLFWRNSLLNCVPQSKIAKKTLKSPILEVQGHSRLLVLTPLKSLSLVLVMMSSISVPICNCFHAIRANSGKITTFRGVDVQASFNLGNCIVTLIAKICVYCWEFHMQVDFVYLKPSCRKSVLKCALQSEIAKKITK